MKYLAAVLVSVAFLLPNLSYAATFEENRQALILQLISLIQQEIASLQAQLAATDTTPLAVSDTTGQITSITNALGSTMTQPAPQPLTPNEPVKPLMFAAFQMQGDTLLITSNKLLDPSKTVFPDGITISKVLFDATNGPVQNGNVANKFIGYPRGETVPVYLYQYELAGAQGTFQVSVSDQEGQSATMTVNN